MAAAVKREAQRLEAAMETAAEKELGKVEGRDKGPEVAKGDD